MAKNSKGKKIYKDSELENLRNEELLRLNELVGRSFDNPPTCLDNFLNSRLVICADTSARIGRYDPMLLYKSSLTDDEIKDLKEPDYNKVYDFQSKLDTCHLKALLPVVNDLVFAEPQTVDSLHDTFCCKNATPVRVKSNGLLAYTMYLLSLDNWICHNWQQVADLQSTFASKNKNLLRRKNFSMSLSTLAKRMKYPSDKQNVYILNNKLYNTIKGLKR